MMSGLVELTATEGALRTDDHPSKRQPDQFLKIMSDLVGLKLKSH